jgi:hypothetical protein
MNLLIKEFAVEARLITVDGITRYASDYEFEKRFAELIVLKCAEIADTAEPFLASDLIKQHFGVVE